MLSEDVEEKEEQEIEIPSFYNVIILNDDYTSMDTVIHILEKYFNKMGAEAQKIMFNAHHHGEAFVEKYPKDIAESYVKFAMDEARQYDSPLNFKIEKDE